MSKTSPYSTLINKTVKRAKSNFTEQCTTKNPRPCEISTTIGLMMMVAKDSNIDTSNIEKLIDEPNLSEKKAHICLCSMLDKFTGKDREDGEIIMEIGFPGMPCPGTTLSHAE